MSDINSFDFSCGLDTELGGDSTRDVERLEKAEDIDLAKLDNELELEASEFRELRDEFDDDPTESREDILLDENRDLDSKGLKEISVWYCLAQEHNSIINLAASRSDDSIEHGFLSSNRRHCWRDHP